MVVVRPSWVTSMKRTALEIDASQVASSSKNSKVAPQLSLKRMEQEAEQKLQIPAAAADPCHLVSSSSNVKVTWTDQTTDVTEKLSLSTLSKAIFDGKYMSSEFRCQPTDSEHTIEKKLMAAINGRGALNLGKGKTLECLAYNQIKTVDGGRLDILVYDKLTRAVPKRWKRKSQMIRLFYLYF